MKNRLHICIRKGILPVLICLTCCTTSFSQSFIFGNEKVKVETGLHFGPSFFLGDLGGNVGKGTRFVKDINFELTKMMKGAFITVYPNHWVGFRVNANYTYLEATDNIINTKGVDELWRKQRNLDFKSDVFELQAGLEIYPTMLFRKYVDYEPRLRPYGFIGGGIFHFNPKGSITGANGQKTWYELHPLKTEGQGFKEYGRKEYKLTQFNIPVGAGIKYYVSDRVNISTELLYRKSFTDYIDDVSTFYIDPALFSNYMSAADAAIARQIHDKVIGIVTPGTTRYSPGTERGNPKNMDAYFSLIVKFGVRLGAIYESTFDRNAAKQTRCPHIF